MVEIRDTKFCVKKLKMKRKKRDFFYLPEQGFDPQMEGEGDDIKSRQGC